MRTKFREALVLAWLSCTTFWSPGAWASEALSAEGLALVGRDSLQGRSSYQLIPHYQGGRWLLYVGHHPGRALNPLSGAVEENGTSVLDVTKPAKPKYLAHRPPSDAPWADKGVMKSGSYHLSICDGSQLPRGQKGRTYLLRTIGDAGHEVLDVTDPSHWRQAAEVVRSERSDADDSHHTHNSTWDCATGLAIVVVSKAGWNASQIFQAFDLSDPTKPRHIRDFDLPGSEPNASRPGGRTLAATKYVNMAHSAAIADGRIYLAYNPFWAGSVQIIDLQKFLTGDPASPAPLAPSDASLHYPVIGRFDFPQYWGAHSALPIVMHAAGDTMGGRPALPRDLLLTLSEGTDATCSQPPHPMFVLDISDPGFPTPISSYVLGAGRGTCRHFAYFGPHNLPRWAPPSISNKLVFLTYFAGGLRVLDIRDPFRPIEVGHYVPAPTANTQYVELKGPLAGRSFDKLPMTNDVALDSRGYIYISDRASTGVHILTMVGEPARIAESR